MTLLKAKTTTAGNFVLHTQELASADGFRNVSKSWFETTTPIRYEIERLAASREERKYVPVSFCHLRPVAKNGRFGLQHRGHIFFPDEYAAGQLGTILGIGVHHPQKLITEMTVDSADVMVRAYENASKGVRDTSGWVLRVEEGNVLRGILPEASTFVENEWYLRVVESAVPGGRLSHWRGDDWTIYGNVLIPDTIRQEADSEYGAMVSLSNSEVGKRVLRQRPSLFRAICLNGNIWGRTRGQDFTFNRRERFDQGALEKTLRANIHDQIPIAIRALDEFLATRTFKTKVSMKAVIAETARELSLSRRLAAAILAGWWLEKLETPDSANSLFGLVNAVTRAGQRESNAMWVRFDEIGGALAAMKRADWENLATRASVLKPRDVDATFAAWALGV